MFGVHRNGRVTSESFYKETILQRNYRKMTITEEGSNFTKDL